MIRDSARRARQDSGWLGSPRRWTVGSIRTAMSVVASGTGFAWLPAHLVQEAVDQGQLAPLDLSGAGVKRSTLYLIQSRSQVLGPAAALRARCLIEAADQWRGMHGQKTPADRERPAGE